ncbi:hypothetical protein ISN44_As08g020840 [Arabidopsis suecica]|uniref:Uncharacterized protein n=1 Tax=Arabidopsis suecica TaxID=45249 RepID=A0A8T2B944_ARASU|nr:hypothetical protein ISN44_As08g020840 [Arabidopsis suecica]
MLTSTGGRLQFSVYDKYLYGLERAIKKMRTQSESSLLSGVRSKREKILEIDGTVTTQPVLEHVGISTWPGIVCIFSIVTVFACVLTTHFCHSTIQVA